MSVSVTNPVYKSINKPLTAWGVERRLFFVALILGAGTFTCFSSLLGAVLMFFTLYGCARQATKSDLQLLRVLLNSSQFKSQYDPLKRDCYRLEALRHDKAQQNR